MKMYLGFEENRCSSLIIQKKKTKTENILKVNAFIVYKNKKVKIKKVQTANLNIKE